MCKWLKKLFGGKKDEKQSTEEGNVMSNQGMTDSTEQNSDQSSEARESEERQN